MAADRVVGGKNKSKRESNGSMDGPGLAGLVNALSSPRRSDLCVATTSERQGVRVWEAELVTCAARTDFVLLFQVGRWPLPGEALQPQCVAFKFRSNCKIKWLPDNEQVPGYTENADWSDVCFMVKVDYTGTQLQRPQQERGVEVGVGGGE